MSFRDDLDGFKTVVDCTIKYSNQITKDARSIIQTANQSQEEILDDLYDSNSFNNKRKYNDKVNFEKNCYEKLEYEIRAAIDYFIALELEKETLIEEEERLIREKKEHNNNVIHSSIDNSAPNQKILIETQQLKYEIELCLRETELHISDLKNFIHHIQANINNNFDQFLENTKKFLRESHPVEDNNIVLIISGEKILVDLERLSLNIKESYQYHIEHGTDFKEGIIQAFEKSIPKSECLSQQEINQHAEILASKFLENQQTFLERSAPTHFIQNKILKLAQHQLNVANNILKDLNKEIRALPSNINNSHSHIDKKKKFVAHVRHFHKESNNILNQAKRTTLAMHAIEQSPTKLALKQNTPHEDVHITRQFK